MISETLWTVDEQGRNTYLSPPDESTTFLERQHAEGAEELRMHVEYETYRFPIDDFEVVFSWLNTVC